MLNELEGHLSLSMRQTDDSFYVGSSHEENSDVCAAMQRQEREYRCANYFAGMPRDDSSNPDIICRLKMCAWSYRVCDYLLINRETVSAAFSFLDRFVDQCFCDRTAYKLASMTCLYMATKMFNTKQMSISSLANLSRGEFSTHHIAEMERLILETLKWKMNPPTVQAYLQRLWTLVPCTESLRQIILSKANFFAELCVFDFQLLSFHDRYQIAIACLLNSMEGLTVPNIRLGLQNAFQMPMSTNTTESDLSSLRERLWILYSYSNQPEEVNVKSVSIKRYSLGDTNSLQVGSYSPVAVQDAC